MPAAPVCSAPGTSIVVKKLPSLSRRKTKGWSSGIEIGADELAAVVDPTDLGVLSTESIDQGKGAVVQKVSAGRVERASVADLAVVCPTACPRLLMSSAAVSQGARKVDCGEDAFVQKKTVGCRFGTSVGAHDLAAVVMSKAAVPNGESG